MAAFRLRGAWVRGGGSRPTEALARPPGKRDAGVYGRAAPCKADSPRSTRRCSFVARFHLPVCIRAGSFCRSARDRAPPSRVARKSSCNATARALLGVVRTSRAHAPGSPLMRKPIISLALLDGRCRPTELPRSGCSAADQWVEFLGTRHPRHTCRAARRRPERRRWGGVPGPTSSPPCPRVTTAGFDGPYPPASVDAGAPAPVGRRAAGGGCDADWRRRGGDVAVSALFLGEATAYASAPVGTSARTSLRRTPARPRRRRRPTASRVTMVAGAGRRPFLAAGFVASAAGGRADRRGGRRGSRLRARSERRVQRACRYRRSSSGSTCRRNGGAAGPYNAGARNGSNTSPKLMPAAQTAADCQSSSCHGGATGNIHLP